MTATPEPSSSARYRPPLRRVARAARDGFVHWLTKPPTVNEIIGFAIYWAALTVLYTVAKSRG